MYIPLSLLAVHTLADFVFQTNWMGSNKSKNWNALLAHTIIYSLFFSYWGPLFVLITFVTHTTTDAITSRITSYLYGNLNDYHFFNSLGWDWLGRVEDNGKFAFWCQPNVHWFFVVIGFDQLIHFATLAWTLRLLQ